MVTLMAEPVLAGLFKTIIKVKKVKGREPYNYSIQRERGVGGGEKWVG